MNTRRLQLVSGGQVKDVRSQEGWDRGEFANRARVRPDNLMAMEHGARFLKRRVARKVRLSIARIFRARAREESNNTYRPDHRKKAKKLRDHRLQLKRIQVCRT